MIVKTIKNNRKFKVESIRYNLMMGMVGEQGGTSFVTTCKEELFHMVAKAVGWDYDDDIMDSFIGASWVEEAIDMENPTIIIWLPMSRKYASARRIKRVLDMLAKKQGLKQVKVWVNEDGNAAFIRPSKWYFKNPIALSGLLTFIRAAARTDFVFQNLKCFISKSRKMHHRDGKHLDVASSNGNVDGFLNKSLPTFKLKPKAAYRTGRTGDHIFLPGIVAYNPDIKYKLCTTAYQVNEPDDWDDDAWNNDWDDDFDEDGW